MLCRNETPVIPEEEHLYDSVRCVVSASKAGSSRRNLVTSQSPTVLFVQQINTYASTHLRSYHTCRMYQDIDEG